MYGWMELKEGRLRDGNKSGGGQGSSCKSDRTESRYRYLASSSRAAVRWEYLDAAETGRGSKQEAEEKK